MFAMFARFDYKSPDLEAEERNYLSIMSGWPGSCSAYGCI